MDGPHFDAWTRRRFGRLAGGITAGLLAAALAAPGAADAGKRKKRKKLKQPKTNAWGCVDAGQPCRGKGAYCCSGLCQGKKPKPGKKDKSRCLAHDSGSCQTGQDYCLSGLVSCGADDAYCFRTTGQAPFCGSEGASACLGCTKDTQCEALFGLGAACVVCHNGCADGSHTICVAAA